MQSERLTTIGARHPTGSVVSPGRQLFVGGDCPPSYAPSPQLMLPLYGQFDRRRGFDARSLSAGVQDARQLPAPAWRVCNLAFERDAQFAGGSLSPHAPRPANGL